MMWSMDGFWTWDNFKYRELGENFTEMIKTAVDGLRTFPTGHNTTGIRYRGI